MTEQKPEAAPQRIPEARRMSADTLKLHPAYASFFGLPSASELETLAGDMRTNPHASYHVEAMPGGTVLYGWQFVLAARLAGCPDMKVTVRLDMDGLNNYAQELEMIDAHLRHGRLSRVTTACCLARAHELDGFVPEEHRRSYQGGKLSEVVAKHLGVSKRSAERYIALADMPRWWQQLFDRGDLNIALAEKVKAFTGEARKAIREAVEGGKKAREAVVDHLPKTRKPFVAPRRELDRFVARARHAVDALSPRVRQVKAIGADHAAALRKIKAVIDEMLQKAGSSTGEVHGDGLSAAVTCGAGAGDLNP
jgi:hypothetical protein